MSGRTPPSTGAWIALVLMVSVAWVAGPRTALARGADFDPASDAWNGLGYLLETAREAHVQVEVSDRLDWSAVSSDEVLLVIAPNVGPGRNGSELRRFIQAGGRLIVADDFRAGDRWIRSFGMQLLQRPGPSKRYAAGVRHLPKLAGGTALGEFLGYHVKDVVLNHPASLIATPVRGWQHRALGRFEDGVRAWAMEAWRPGEQGRVLGVSDPSLFINAMVRRFYGNKQASANVLRFFCFEGETCRVRLLSNLQHVDGTFKSKTTSTGMDWGIRRHLRSLMETIATLLTQRSLRPLWWLLVVFAMVAPMVRFARLPGPLLPPAAPDRDNQGRMRHTVRAWLARPGADYRRPARQLAQHLTRTVEHADYEVSGRGRALDASKPSASLQETVDRLVRRGHLAAASGRRILELVTVLEEVAERVAEPVGRERFTQLAAEVDWAEQVLSHTTQGRRVG